ncbi:hypothetical protein tb265_36460 [Gemmatimonadetes bacterium T265]|nr:hypothetical protein tb265_36460 [Gemmatimonadetes bacterium T265]
MQRRIDLAHRARACAAVGASAALCAGAGRAAGAQGATVVTSGRPSDWTDAAVGSEEENYLRVLQLVGVARPRPWSVRPFGPGELHGLVRAGVPHPWAARVAGDTVTGGDTARSAARAPRRTIYLRTVGAATGVAVNTGFPFSMNDGAIWTGRGPTVYASGGVAADYTPTPWARVSIRVEPLAFVASNLAVSIASNGQTGALRYGDALEPQRIDAPQRFGSGAYGRVDPGQSTARVDVAGLAVGVSTANQWWGPALTDPQILGYNAAGFPHVFVGTSRPLWFGFGTVHARLLAGRLAQSAYSPMPADSAYRTASGAAAALTLDAVPGLELGGTRFYHEPWTGASHALSRITAPLGGFFGSEVANVAQNQISSLFARWAFAPSGLEVWGEYMRNDAAADVRDLEQEPDQNSGFTVGLRKARTNADGSIGAFRVEWLDDRITHLERVRGQVRPYEHTQLRQGHTQLGQVLGSDGGQGGSSVTLGYDRYVRDGRWTFEGARRVVQTSLGESAPEAAWDVLYYLRVERLRFGRRRDLMLGASAMPELNRNFGRDAFNLRLDAGFRF